MLAVIPFTAGDVSLDGIFYSCSVLAFDGDRQYEALTLAIWLFAIVIMTILFSNMLVRSTSDLMQNCVQVSDETDNVQAHVEMCRGHVGSSCSVACYQYTLLEVDVLFVLLHDDPQSVMI